MLYQVSLIKHGRSGARVARRFAVTASSHSEAQELIRSVANLDDALVRGCEMQVKAAGEQIAEIIGYQAEVEGVL